MTETGSDTHEQPPALQAIRDGETITISADGQKWVGSWHPPFTPPDGKAHGATGLCVTDDGNIVLVSENGKHWGLPGGRPEGNETWEDVLRREMQEEACATVIQARLLGYARSVCIEGPEKGLVLVRSKWLANVELAPWKPQFEILHRRVVAANEALNYLTTADIFARITLRLFREAGIS